MCEGVFTESRNESKYVRSERRKVERALRRLGAASVERLSALTKMSVTGVCYAIGRLQDEGRVHYSLGLELWSLRDDCAVRPPMRTPWNGARIID